MLKSLALVSLAAASVLLVRPAVADMPQCSQRESVVSYLEKKYKESPVAVGVTSNGGLVEVLTTDGGGTWTIIVTSAKGWSCLVAAGEGWKMMAMKPDEGPNT